MPNSRLTSNTVAALSLPKGHCGKSAAKRGRQS